MVSIPYIPDRGDIIKVDFGSKEMTPDLVKRAFILQESGLSFEDIATTLNAEMQQGREQQGYRPAFVLSPLKYNQMASMVLACPITTRIKGLSFEVVLTNGMKTIGVVLTDQIKSFDWKIRKILFVEKANLDLIEEVQAKIETLIFMKVDLR